MKKVFKILGWTIFSLVMLALLAIGIACYIVTSPSHLTPLVRQIAGNFITCDYEIGNVELTIFSTFPDAEVTIDGLVLINPKEGATNDTIVSAQRVKAKLDIKQLIFGNSLQVDHVTLEDASLHYYIAQDGTTNFDIFPPSEEETEVDTTAFSLPFDTLCVKALTIQARELTYVNEQDSMWASLGATMLIASASSWNEFDLNLDADDVCARLQDMTYADSMHLLFDSPLHVNLDSMHFGLDHAQVALDSFAMTLDGTIMLGDSLNLDMRLETHDTWQIEPLMALLPHDWTAGVEEFKPKGDFSLTTTVQGTVSDSQLPVVKVEKLKANLWKSHFDITGQISDIATDMLLDIQMAMKVHVPDFKQFIPEDIVIQSTQTEGTADVQLRLSDLENGYLSQGQADFKMRSLSVKMDTTLDTQLDAPTIHIEGTQLLSDNAKYHLSLTGNRITGHYNDINADLQGTKLNASLVGGKTIKADLSAHTFEGRVGENINGKTRDLHCKVSARYKQEGENLLLQWNPKVNIQLTEGVIEAPEQLPEVLQIPSIDFYYSNRKMTINDSRIKIGNSDIELQGEVEHIGKWLQKKDTLLGALHITSNHCDANQLLNWLSGDRGSDETDEDVAKREAQTQDSTATTAHPFLVPLDVNLALTTHLKEVEWFNETAKDLKGGIYVQNGDVVLKEIGFVCRAAKLQLTAIYRSPFPTHLYFGFDYHMLDIDIDELRTLVPIVDETVPMLRSFGGDAEFHLAGETYMDSQYQIKVNNLRGAMSVAGKNLIVRDSEEFGKIAKLLLFKKQSENYIDSLNAEATIYRKNITIYPLCVQMNNYMVAAGGRHNTDMTLSYDINVLKPIYLGVNISGTIDDMDIKLAPCRWADDFRPHWYQKVDEETKMLKERIRQSMRRNVHIE